MTQRSDLTFCPPGDGWFEEIYDLEQRSFSQPWSRKALEDERENPCADLLICTDGGRLLGYIGMLRVLDESEVAHIAVEPAERSRGVGLALLQEMLALQREKGVTTVTLEVRESNLPARRCYEKAGFALLGRRPRYYQKPEEDALLLGLKLS